MQAARLNAVRIRRIAALALAASMMRLSVARADVVCAQHSHAPASRPAVPSHAMDHGETTPAPIHDARHEAPTQHQACDTPALPDCCQALASCSLSFGGQATVAAFLPTTTDAAVAALIEIPLSRVTTPDPPPPRA
jgi:hypothetical protein